MKKERMEIIKMVGEGKISADDAVKLLESIKGSGVSAGEILDGVKEKVSDMMSDAKPVVKKYAVKAKDKAKEVGGGVYEKGKAKVEKIKNKAKSSDIADEIIEPVEEIFEAAEDKAEEIKDKAEEIKEKAMDKAEEIKDKAEEKIEDIKEDVKKASEKAEESAEKIAEEVKEK